MIIVQLHVYFSYIFLHFLFWFVWEDISDIYESISFQYNAWYISVFLSRPVEYYEIQLLNLTDMNYV